MPQPHCFTCRLFRALAFSGIGAAITGGGAVWLGMAKNDAMMLAIPGALFGIMLMRQLEMKKRNSGSE